MKWFYVHRVTASQLRKLMRVLAEQGDADAPNASTGHWISM
jgi:hypothetical protein